MNRIRHAYLEIAPHLEPYFVTSRHDDLAAIFSTYGVPPVARSSIGGGLHHAFVMTQGMVGIINAMVAAVFAALLAALVGAPTVMVVGAGALALALALAAQLAVGLSALERLRERMTFHFPSASDK
jgi:small-conductance mechanosensitive channel